MINHVPPYGQSLIFFVMLRADSQVGDKVGDHCSTVTREAEVGRKVDPMVICLFHLILIRRLFFSGSNGLALAGRMSQSPFVVPMKSAIRRMTFTQEHPLTAYR
jgi:hypothetical protein